MRGEEEGGGGGAASVTLRGRDRARFSLLLGASPARR